MFYGTGCRTDEVRTMLIEHIDYMRRRIKVQSQVGTRFVLFSIRVERALRRYIGDRRQDYVFAQQKHLQSYRPNWTLAAPGGRKCRWKLYDASGGLGDSEKKMDYQQAWAHFVKVAKRDEAQRPLGSRPLSHATIQKAVAEGRTSGGYSNQSEELSAHLCDAPAG